MVAVDLLEGVQAQAPELPSVVGLLVVAQAPACMVLPYPFALHPLAFHPPACPSCELLVGHGASMLVAVVLRPAALCHARRVRLGQLLLHRHHLP